MYNLSTVNGFGEFELFIGNVSLEEIASLLAKSYVDDMIIEKVHN